MAVGGELTHPPPPSPLFHNQTASNPPRRDCRGRKTAWYVRFTITLRLNDGQTAGTKFNRWGWSQATVVTLNYGMQYHQKMSAETTPTDVMGKQAATRGPRGGDDLQIVGEKFHSRERYHTGESVLRCPKNPIDALP